MRSKYLLFLALLILVSCKKEIRTLSDYNKYLNDMDHGLKKERTFNNLKIGVKLLPPDYLLLKEINSIAKESYSKKLSEYQKSLSFLLTLTFGDGKAEAGNNPVAFGVNDYQEYKERFIHLNFELYEDIKLVLDNKEEYTPVLISFENTYGQGDALNTTIVFSPKKDKTEFVKTSSYTFVYNDRIYSTGLNKFTFKKEDLENSPHINI